MNYLELAKVSADFVRDERDLIYLVLAIIYLVLDRVVRKADSTEANSLSELVESKLVKALGPKQTETKENENAP